MLFLPVPQTPTYTQKTCQGPKTEKLAERKDEIRQIGIYKSYKTDNQSVKQSACIQQKYLFAPQKQTIEVKASASDAVNI